MGDLALDTAVEECGSGRYRARLSRDWEIWGPNGGYVAAVALRAAAAATRMPRPASFTCQFLNVANFDAVDLEVSVLRASKRAEALRVSMRQEERPIVEALIWCTADGDGLEHDVSDMPAVPAVDKLKGLEEVSTADELVGRHRFWENFDVRPIHYVPWSTRPVGPPVWREWYRFRSGNDWSDPFVDAARAVILIDTMVWPAARQAYAANDQRYLAPSLDVTVQFHRMAPTSSWLLADACAPIAANGLIGGTTRVWTSDGRLMASGGSQLFCRPVRPAS